MRYMLVPWTSILVYTFFSFFWGQNGLYAQKHLEAECLRLSENQAKLEHTSKDIRKTKDNLMRDDDALSVYVRQLDYGRGGDEKFVRIKGLGIALNNTPSAGQVFYAAAPDFVPDITIKLISISFGLVVLLFFLIRDFLPWRGLP